MATDTADGRSDHVRGLTVTTLAAILGILSAFASKAVATAPQDATAAYVVVAVIAVQLAVLRGTGLVDDFDAKSVLFVAFMTFSLWFVSLTILWTADVTV